MTDAINKALSVIKKAKHITAFTGAGISVDSGIPPFRGENGIWNKYDPKIFDLQYFIENPKEDWELIYKVFYKTIMEAKPNTAHFALANLERKGKLKAIITQNIDNLHQKAGSKTVYEFHGNTCDVVCLDCGRKYSVTSLDLSNLPPRCECGGLLKPDFVFFGESIPQDVLEASLNETQVADVFLVVGTTGVIYPAGEIPRLAKRNGSAIIEINIEPSEYTGSITDIFIEEKASVVLKWLETNL